MSLPFLEESPFVSSRSIASKIFRKINSSTGRICEEKKSRGEKSIGTEALRKTAEYRSKHVHVSRRFNNGLESAQRIRIIGRSIVKELLGRGWH